MQKIDTIYLDQKWMNPVKVKAQLIACPLCLKIPIFQQNPIECSFCNSLLCKLCIQDHNSFVQEQDRSCPICQNYLVANKQRHIAKKNAFQNATFKCRECPQFKDSNYKQFSEHIQLHQADTNSQLKNKQQQLFKYELVDNTGVNFVWGESEQIAINYCQHANINYCYFLGSNDKPLIIDLKKEEGYFEQQSQKMKLLKSKNEVIKNLREYTLWMLQKNKRRIYFDHYWKDQVQQGFTNYQLNHKLNQMHVQKQNIMLRINFQSKEIIVPTTQEIFNLKSQKIQFK